MQKVLIAGATGYLALKAAVMQNDFDAPKAGTHLLKEYYDEFSSQL